MSSKILLRQPEKPDMGVMQRFTCCERILFVCLGNICRSPSAEAIFNHLASKRRGQILFSVDSAGTHDYHIGKPPDPRTIEAARKAGMDISDLRARQVTIEDFSHFDHILAMDERNRCFLQEMCPPEHKHKIEPIVSYLDVTTLNGVPDPFLGNTQDFDNMIKLLFKICEAILDGLERCASLETESAQRWGI